MRWEWGGEGEDGEVAGVDKKRRLMRRCRVVFQGRFIRVMSKRTICSESLLECIYVAGRERIQYTNGVGHDVLRDQRGHMNDAF